MFHHQQMANNEVSSTDGEVDEPTKGMRMQADRAHTLDRAHTFKYHHVAPKRNIAPQAAHSPVPSLVDLEKLASVQSHVNSSPL
jgi:hypothetical protein